MHMGQDRSSGVIVGQLKNRVTRRTDMKDVEDEIKTLMEHDPKFNTKQVMKIN